MLEVLTMISLTVLSPAGLIFASTLLEQILKSIKIPMVREAAL